MIPSHSHALPPLDCSVRIARPGPEFQVVWAVAGFLILSVAMGADVRVMSESIARDDFTDKKGAELLLVGFNCAVGPLSGNIANRIVTGIQPIYEDASGHRTTGQFHGNQGEQALTVQAKPGYAVGGVVARSALALDGFQVTFMKRSDDRKRLDPTSTYHSEWIGGPGGGAVVEMGGDGEVIIGIFGRSSGNLLSLGLQYADGSFSRSGDTRRAQLANPAKSAIAKADVITRRVVPVVVPAPDPLPKPEPPRPTIDLATLEARSLQMIKEGTPEKAWRAASMIAEAKREELRRNLPGLDEAGRLEFLRQLRPYDVVASVGAGRAVAQAALTSKGIVLESLIEDQRAAQLLGREVASLRAEERMFTWRFLKITVEDVLAKLPAEMALVELVRYRRHVNGGQATDWYGAAILRRYKTPVFVPATRSAAEIDTAVRAYRAAIEAVAGGVRDDQTVERGGRALHDWLAAGWYPHLTGARQVVICPDAALNFLPFSTLLDGDGNFLAEKFTIYYSTSGRDLVARQPANVIADPPVIFADPDFGGSGELEIEIVGSRTGLGALQFGKLAGTKTEAEKVGGILLEMRKKKQPPTIRLGKDATEAALREVQSPEILHLATHGFFLDQAEGVGMSRSGLALSGAQATVESLRRGEKPDPGNDGIFLAEEAGQLDLRATELVTLSACRTAVGLTEPGEGVMGLRRALVQAGARNVLMTLWDIADEPTAEFMEAFYRRYVGTGNAPLALSDVQRERLQRLRKDEGLAVAAYLAGAFVMSAQATRKDDVEQLRSEEIREVERVRMEAERVAVAGRLEVERMALQNEFITNSLEMKFIPVPGTSVLFCEHETRVKDYAAFAAANPGVDMKWKDLEYEGHKQSSNHPVVNVSWEDAKAFCLWLSANEGKTYRLPTDHEWSVAVGIGGQENSSASPEDKQGKIAGYPWGSVWPPPAGYGNFSGSESAASKIEGYTDQHPFTAPVKSYNVGKYGLYDLSGNVWEWCEDSSSKKEPYRVLRGGSWYDPSEILLRSSCRNGGRPAYRIRSYGFRCVVSAAR